MFVGNYREPNAEQRTGRGESSDGPPDCTRKKRPEDAEAKLRELEKKIGIDPGGWSLASQPLFHPTPEMLQISAVLGPKLAAAMKSDEAAKVRAVTAEMLSVLGDQTGVLPANEDWKRAGLLAADWPLRQPCWSNFNYNAFSVSLLAHAFRIGGETKYLEGALQKFCVGVAPGQAPNGRWIDSHNARTVYIT